MSNLTTPQAPFIAASEFYLDAALLKSCSAPTNTLDAALHLIPPPTIAKLSKAGPPRVKDMRTAGVTKQIVSHVPVNAASHLYPDLNDALYRAVCLQSDRFAGMALLPMNSAVEAASELQRCVTKYRFVGGVLGLSVDTFGPAYEELWMMAERYRVPIALKEVWPRLQDVQEYRNKFPDSFLGPLVTNLHTAHKSSPLPILQIYASGVFDRHPNLRLILAQHGLSVTSLLPRLDAATSSIPAAQRPVRSFLDVWQHNIYVTTEEVHDLANMRNLVEHTPIDRVLYATNYPFKESGRELMTELKESGIVGKEEWERIAWRNAAWLFRVQATSHSSGANGQRSSD